MNITYWSDYACPFCYIGETRMKKAVKELEEEKKIAKDQVTLTMKAFQLDPMAGTHATGDTLTRFAKKYGLTMADAHERIDAISEMGIQEGLDFKYATTLFTNTMDAHRLTKLAIHTADKKTVERLIERLMKAYFSDNKELADHTLLQKIGEEVGLDKDAVKEVLDSDKYRDEVEADEREAYSYGINAVPFFIIGNKYGVSGAQEKDLMKEVILKAISEDKKEKEIAEAARAVASATSGMACGPDGCSIALHQASLNK